MAIKVAKLIAEIGVDVSQAVTGINSFSARLGNLSSSLMSKGAWMSAGLTTPIVMGFKDMIEASSQFEENMNMLQAVSGATGEDLAALRSKAFELGADLTLPATSAADAAEAMLEMSKAGLSVTDILDGIRGVLEMSVAGELGNARAAEIASNALNMWSLKGEEAGRVADLLAAAANASSAEIWDLANGMVAGGATFASAKIPIEDMVALMGVLANAGIEGEHSGTELRRMFIDMQAPNAKASEEMKNLGVSVFDTAGNFVGAREAILRFSDAMNKMTPEQLAKSMNIIFGVYGGEAAKILTALSRGIDAFDKMKETITKGGEAAAVAKARMEGLPGGIQAFQNAAETTALVLGDSVNPEVTELANGVAKVMLGFSQLDPQTQNMIVKYGLLAAAAGPAIFTVGQLASAVGLLVGVFGSPWGIGAAAAAGAILLLGSMIEDKQVIIDKGRESLGKLWDIWKDGLQPGDLDASIAVIGDFATTVGTEVGKIDWQGMVVNFNKKLVEMTNDFTDWANDTTFFKDLGSTIGWTIGTGLGEGISLAVYDVGVWFREGGLEAALDVPGTMAKIGADMAGGLVTAFIEGLIGVDISEDLSKWFIEAIKRALMYANPATLFIQSIEDALQGLNWMDVAQRAVDMPDMQGMRLSDYERRDLGVAGARASGGPVTAMTPYLVGERGPEVFLPQTSGRIVANNEMGAMVKELGALTREIRSLVESRSNAMADARLARAMTLTGAQVQR